MLMLLGASTVAFLAIVVSASDDAHQAFWPPSNIASLIDPADGRINLALRPRVVSPPHTGYSANYYELLITSLASDVKVNREHSQLRRMVDAQQSLLQQPNRPQYSLYPQVLNMRQIVRQVQSGIPLEEEPINDPPLIPIHTPDRVCQQSANKWPDLVILVESCLDCASARQHARETYMQSSLWLEMYVQFVFSIAISDNRLGVKERKTFAHLYPGLEKEHKEHGDLLIGGPFDSKMLQTWNRIQAFRWLSVFCQERVPLYLFINSKYSIAPRNLITFLRGIPRDLQLILNAGLRPQTLMVPRSGLDPVDHDEIPWNRYPEHYNDTVFFVGAELLIKASITMAFTRPYRNSAAYLGFVWAKLDYPSLHLPEIIKEKGNYSEISASSVVGTAYLDRYMDWSNGFLFSP
ncbi:Hexosyltransferase [Fasciola hepatica]|uniref:Hexosyltransferase n=1 Tax=Fasciola hepatica TaxID=6192 RepID=A0A4E0RHP0_FASHE|nr:Hexosyltransferase [Fasciola hepatica]